MANTPVVVLDDTLTDIADAIRGKNGSSDTYKPSEMADAIDNIPSGGGVTVEALTATENGTYQEEGKAYSPVNVNVQFVGLPRAVSSTGGYGFPTQQFTFSLPSTANEILGRSLAYAFYGCNTITSADLSSLTSLNNQYAVSYAFDDCTSLTSVDLSSLKTITASNALSSAFYGCTSLSSVDFSSLTSITGSSALASTFYNCTSLTSVDLSSLTTINASNALSYTFQRCSNLTSVNFSSLSTVKGSRALTNCFNNCTSLSSLSFPSLTASSFGSGTDQFNSMLQGVTGCTVHFPAGTQAKIETMSGYPNFGGTNTTVLFDL